MPKSSKALWDFKHQKSEWLKLPVDDIGYIDCKELLSMPEKEFRSLIGKMAENRYNLNGFRNYKNKWREYLGLDSTQDKTILDFGCGVGLEALQFQAKNKVMVADINQESLDVAKRLLGNVKSYLISNEAPYFTCPKYDVFYANGVLHHTPKFREILERAVELLKPNGEIRLMLYSDIGWENAGPDPVSYFDEVGDYADWYNKDKLEQLVGDFLDVYFCEYITSNNGYLVAKMRVK